MPQHHPIFDMDVLKALVTLEVVEKAVIEVKDEVVAAMKLFQKLSKLAEEELKLRLGISWGLRGD